jgi:hypothetical protein
VFGRESEELYLQIATVQVSDRECRAEESGKSKGVRIVSDLMLGTHIKMIE